MLKAYKYSNEDLERMGFDPKQGSMRLEGDVEMVSDPKRADVFVMPIPTFTLSERENLGGNIGNDNLHKIADYLGIDKNLERHAFTDCSDYDPTFTDFPNAIYIRCNMKRWMKQKYPRMIPWFWPVKNLSECFVDVPFKYDVGFQGWLSCECRQNAVDDCQRLANHGKMTVDFATYKDFFGYIENSPEGERRRYEFLRSLRECRIQLCPRSIDGVFPYRFFEAMSAGRVAALYCDNYCLPWENKVDYQSCTLLFSEAEAKQAGTTLGDILKNHSDKDLIEMGCEARSYWVKWLNAEKQESLFTEAIKELLDVK